MTPSIAVIIPVYKDDTTLTALLQNLRNLDVAEIIIADGEARQHMPQSLQLQICDNIRSKLIWLAATPKGRGPQIQAGIERAQSDYILILHADSHLDSNAAHAIRSNLAKRHISLGTFTLKFDTKRRVFSLFAWISRIDSTLTTFGDQGFFFRRKDYKALDLDLRLFPLLEDVALRRAFKQTGRITRSRIIIMTSTRRFMQRGIWATQLFNAQILWRYMRGQTPATLYRAYYQTPIDTPRTALKKPVTKRA